MSNYLIHYASKYYDPQKASEYNHQYYEEHKQLKGRDNSSTPTQLENIKNNLKILQDKLKGESNLTATDTVKKASISSAVTKAVSSIRQQVQTQREEILESYPEYQSEWYDPSKANSSSTAGLNAEGRAVAREVKSSINKKRDEDVETAKESLANSIEDIKKQIEEVKTLSADERVAKKEEIAEAIESLKEDATSIKEQISENLTKKTEDAQESISNRTASDKRTTDAIRAQIRALGSGKSSKKKRAELQAKIDEINADRMEDTAAIRNELKDERKTASSDKKAVDSQLKQDLKEQKSILKVFNESNIKARNEKVSELKGSMDAFKKDTKSKIVDIKKNAESTYLSELEKIKSISSYQSKKKS